MATRCDEFLDQATRHSTALSADDTAHLHECAECRAWFAAARPALHLFAVAAGGAKDSSRLAGDDSLARAAELDWDAIFAERRGLAGGEVPREFAAESASMVVEPRDGELVRESEPNKQALLGVDAEHKHAWRNWGNALARLAAMVAIVALALSFLRPPRQDADQSNFAAPGALLRADATLDSLGLVAACVEPQQLDIHTARLAEHLVELPCCTRCHRAERPPSVAPALEPASPHAALLARTNGGDSARVRKISNSCLLCHNG